jgi:16S rRNA (cytosine1402-N4)-methyltransferase
MIILRVNLGKFKQYVLKMTNTPIAEKLHIPVLLEEILNEFMPVIARDTELRYFDGTFGRGGHLQAMLEKNPTLKAIAFDRDPQAIEYAKSNFSEDIKAGRLEIVHKNFSDFKTDDYGKFNLMLIDLGVSSPQLDQAERGFSFYHDGPLDMRMDTSKGLTAAEVIETFSEDELNRMFKEYGEIQRTYRVVQAIVSDRKTKPFTRTRELASLIERVDGWRRKGFHPATQYFMALRMQVNQELQEIENSLVPLIHGLRSGGRLAVLTFHSLEDRIVKRAFKEHETLGFSVHKKVIQPKWEEQKINSRARSAKLRVFERI